MYTCILSEWVLTMECYNSCFSLQSAFSWFIKVVCFSWTIFALSSVRELVHMFFALSSVREFQHSAFSCLDLLLNVFCTWRDARLLRYISSVHLWHLILMQLAVESFCLHGPTFTKIPVCFHCVLVTYDLQGISNGL